MNEKQKVEQFLKDNPTTLELYLSDGGFDEDYLLQCPLECVEDLLRPYMT